MQIKHVLAENFLSHESLNLGLANLGLVLIEGENRDQGGSNGAGKSTIFEAIVWALFGTTSRGLKGDDVIRLDLKKNPVKNTRVVLDIELDGHLVQVARHRKHSKFENKVLLFIDGKEITLGTNQETDAKIEELLQIDEASFVSAVMYPQDWKGFASLTDAQQKDILDKILGTQRYAEAQERLKAKVKKTQTSMTSLKARRTAMQAQITQLQNNAANLQEQHEHFERTHGQKVQNAAEQVRIQENTPPFVDQSLDAKVANLRESVTALNLNALYQQLQLKQQAYQTADKQLASEKARLDTIKGQLSTAGPEPEQPPHDLDLMNAAERKSRDELVALRSDAAGKERELKAIQQLQAKRDAETNCPTCGELLSEASKDRMYGKLSQDVDRIRNELEHCRQAIVNKENLFATAGRSLAELNRKAEAWRTWKTKTEPAAQVPQLELAVSVLTETLARTRSEYESIAAQYKTGYDSACNYNKQIEDFSREKQAQQSAYSNWQSQLNILRAALQQIVNDRSPFEALRQKALADLEVAKRSIRMSEIVEQTLVRDLMYQEFWVEGFGNAGVKSLLLDTVAPFLSYRASEYLEALTGGTARVEFRTQKTLGSGERRDKCEVKVSYAFGGDKYQGVSGGERKRTDLVCLLALGDLASSRSFSPVGIRFFDEPFDGLDGPGAEQVVQLLRTRILPQAGTVLVVSHDDAVKSLIDRRLTIIKEGGVSRVQL